MSTSTPTSRTLTDSSLAKIDVTSVAKRIFTVPTYLTQAAWDIAVRWSQPVIHDQYCGLGIEPGENYEDVRLWDVLFMARSGVNRLLSGRPSYQHSSVPFTLTVVPDRADFVDASEIELYLHAAAEGLIVHSAKSLALMRLG